MIKLKKYPNRRIYDTSISCYITLDDVRDMVITGEPFNVVDSRTGQDLTRATLLQILFSIEEDKSVALLSETTVSNLIQLHASPDKAKLAKVIEQFLGNT